MKSLLLTCFRAMTLLVFGLLMMAGCGGGGDSSQDATGTTPVAVYVGDAFKDDFDQVWTTLYRVEASIDGAQWRPVFDEAEGVDLNLAALSETVRFMGALNLRSGQYTVARVTIGETMRLVANDGTVSNPTVQAPNGASSDGKYSFTVDMPLDARPGRMPNLVLDFDLENFALVGDVLQIDVRAMDPGRFGRMRQEGWLRGTVSELRPGVGFKLSMRTLRAVDVRLTEETVVTSESTGQPATLADGQLVSVQGTIDRETRVLTAISIQVRDGQAGANRFAVLGQVAAIDARAGSFEVRPEWVYGFRPQNPNVTVQTSSSTVFLKRRMETSSFDELTLRQTVMVSGSYDETTQVLTARRVMLR